MRTSQLDQIVRQKDPELLRAVQHLACNETERGIALLREEGRVTEIPVGPHVQLTKRDSLRVVSTPAPCSKAKAAHWLRQDMS